MCAAGEDSSPEVSAGLAKDPASEEAGYSNRRDSAEAATHKAHL